jgi:hypothetical protein
MLGADIVGVNDGARDGELVDGVNVGEFEGTDVKGE